MCSLTQPIVEDCFHFETSMLPIFKEKSKYPDFLHIQYRRPYYSG